MERLKNPAIWCALLYACAASVEAIWQFPVGSVGFKVTQLIQAITAQAGTLLFDRVLGKGKAS